MISKKSKLIITHVGLKIREIRIRRGYTISKLANISKIEYSHLSKIELGKINTTIKQLKKISIALNVNLIYFFTNLNDKHYLIENDEIPLSNFSEIQQKSKEDFII